MKLESLHRVFFLGIGGIGMSAIARFFKQAGVEVSGYDRTETALTRQLEEEGIPVSFSEADPLPSDLDLVVFTPAIPASHPHFAACTQQQIPLMKRAEVLGVITRSRKAIAVAGTHGKTTTSAILTHMLRTAGLDCSAFLGGIAANYGTNFLLGQSEWVVIEADEYDRSFLQLYPSLLIVNALDPDHLDIYGDASAMLDTYYQLMGQVREGGTLLLREGLDVPASVGADQRLNRYSFGMGARDFEVSNIRQIGPHTVFDLRWQDRVMRDIHFTLPGEHNVHNAAAALAVGLLLGRDEGALREGLSSFRGVDRRFQVHFDRDGCTYVDDYAHHPVEVEGLIRAARSRFPGRRLTGIFQPHLFSRTRDFGPAFAAALDLLDEPILTDIYPARELPMPGIDAQWLLAQMEHPDKHLVPRAALLEYIRDRDFDVLLTIGAGDVDALTPEIVSYLNQLHP